MKRLRVFKNNKLIEQKKWHKHFFKNVKDELQNLYPCLDLEKKNLYFTINFNMFNSFESLSISTDSFKNEILTIESILNDKDQILDTSDICGLLN